MSLDSLWEVVDSVDKFVTGITIDDSSIPYLRLVLGFIAAEYVFHTYLDLRQRNAIASRDPPEELNGNYTDEHLAKTRAYSLDKKNFALVKGVWDVGQSLCVLAFGGFPWMWSLSEQLTAKVRPGWENNEYMTSIAFTLITSVLMTIEGIPWSLYSTFVIEQRHGFNKQTLGLFFTDMIKSLGLTVVLVPPILSACIYILRIASPYMPLYLWVFLFALQMVMLVVYPALIAPLFNKYSPLPEGSLRTGIEALATRLAFPLRTLYVMDGSKRSGHSNAYMYGFGKSKRIVLFDTLLAQCNEDQVIAVLAHELGHWKLGHTVWLMGVQQLVMLSQFMLFALVRSSSHLLAEFGFVGKQPVIISLMLFGMCLGPVDSFIGWLFNLLSRRYEFQADAFAVTMQQEAPLAEALKVLDKENKSDFVVDSFYSQYHYSHPPLAERLRAIHAAGKKLL